MQINVQRISPVVMELQIEVPAEAVGAEVTKAYANLGKKAHVKGYRPGKAPRQTLQHLFGAQVMGDVVNALVQTTLPKALTEKSIQPVNTPEVVEAGQVSEKTSFSYKARVEVQPDIDDSTLKYEGLELTRPVTEVTDAMVDEQIEALRQRQATLKAPEAKRAAKAGDVLTIDFTLAIDGKEVKDGGGQGVQVELGGGQLLPELDAALLGKSVDETVKATAAFPENHPRPESRGKAGTFDVKVTDLKEKVLPALDDEFAKDLNAGFTTVAELKTDVRAKLEKALKENAETQLAEQIVAKLNELNPLEVPPSLVEQQRRLMEQEVAMQARRASAKFTREQAQNLIAALHADAERKVRAGLLMAAIAKKHEFKVTDEDIEKAYVELAEETGKNVAKVKAEYRDAQKRQILIGMILEDKILDFLESKAKVSDAKPGQDDAKSDAKAEGAAEGEGKKPKKAKAEK